ncbi:MAG: SsrA-binding protein SmpB [Candidatus Firestonebacteria bacterium]
MKVIIENRKAFFDYFILEKYEAGIALVGTEVKSIRESKVNLKDSFARVDKGEIFLYNMHISPYLYGNIHNVLPTRKRKLLLHKTEINRLLGKLSQKNLTLVPLKIYLKGNKIKIELALAKGKKHFDKRDVIKKREVEREIKSALKEKVKGG